MLSFFNRKVWGYSEDELVTTHSIRSPVPDTHSAESIFDGITYSKGAATMKQLMSLIGEEAFSKALTSYFHKHSLSNAVLDDLLASMEPFF
jgi:aminopeptidase N